MGFCPYICVICYFIGDNGWGHSEDVENVLKKLKAKFEPWNFDKDKKKEYDDICNMWWVPQEDVCNLCWEKDYKIQLMRSKIILKNPKKNEDTT
jgi:hypothetical protein